MAPQDRQLPRKLSPEGWGTHEVSPQPGHATWYILSSLVQTSGVSKSSAFLTAASRMLEGRRNGS